MIPIAPIRPALPTTQPKRIYMITPKIVRIEGVKTPANAPNLFFSAMNYWIGRILLILGVNI